MGWVYIHIYIYIYTKITTTRCIDVVAGAELVIELSASTPESKVLILFK